MLCTGRISPSGGALRLVESAPCVQRGEHMRHPSRPMASVRERANCWAQLAAVLGGTEGLEGGAGRAWEWEIELNVKIGVPRRCWRRAAHL